MALRSQFTGRILPGVGRSPGGYIDASVETHEVHNLVGNMLLVEPKLKSAASRALAKNGTQLRKAVRAHASGRPGPRIITKTYWRSIKIARNNRSGIAESVVYTDEPYGRRLEWGFFGYDSLGRYFTQPPYPHFGPAMREVGPQFEQDAVAAAMWSVRGL